MRSLAESRNRWDHTFANASNLSDLRISVKQGLERSPCTHGLRSVCWKAFLVFENLDQSTWPKTIRDARSAYSSLKEHLLRDIKHPNDVSGDDPLADDEKSPWNNLRKDELLRAEIFQDVERCMPENLYFREPRTQAMLLDILFIYCKLNADIGYRQGMHEILAPIIWVVSRDAVQLDVTEEGSSTIEDNDQLILSMLSSGYIEHDAFTLFGILMQTAKSFYETTISIPPKTGISATGSSAIVERSRRIHEEYLDKVDAELAKHLADIDILPQIFVIRWIRLLFGREFPFEDVLCVWDIMFAEDPGLSLVDFICVAMLIRIRWELIAADHSAALALLLRYPSPGPPNGPITFVEDALQLRRNLNSGLGSRLILKYSGRTPVYSSSKMMRTPIHSPRASEDLSRTRSPLRSPGQILSESGGIEGLLQEAAKGVYRRSEQWGLGPAIRSAVQGLQSGNSSPYRATAYYRGSVDNTDETATRLSLRVKAIEERNMALAKMLQVSLEELSTQAKDLEGLKQKRAADNLTLTIVKLQYVKVHLENSNLPVAGEQQEDVHVSDKLSLHTEESGMAASSPPSGSVAVGQAQRRLSKSSESGRRSPVRAPMGRPPNISITPQISIAQESLATPRVGSPFQNSRPTLASSSFSWMLGSEEDKASFTSSSPFTPEKDRKSNARGKAGFLFGDDTEDSAPTRPRERSRDDKEDDDGFTLGTLRGAIKR